MTAQFLTGATAMGSMVIALFFVRFWQSSEDRFFALFAAGFAILGANQLVLGFLDEGSDARPALYLMRLLAFALIAAAVVDKNRPPRRP
jgi:uncharacterized protein DUF5985